MNETNRVRILPEVVVNQIAAGEVIERPASVVKELMENSLDAGAQVIKVRVEGAAGKLISVADDGHGLSPDDALLALERHSTSKIASVNDLETVATMGFRGEALPSIAAVSRFALESRRPGDEVGTRLVVEGGAVRSSAPAALPAGTTITVRQLFFNTPVRRKFLRSPDTERGHVVKAFLRLAMVNPGIRFELKADGDDMYILAAVDSFRRRVEAIFGREVVSELVPVEARDEGCTLEGFVADPRRPSPGIFQYFFVNRRPVDDRLITAALREGFGGAGRVQRMDYILKLAADPRDMDVNVHPTKREVRFSHPSRIFGFVSRALSGALETVAPPAADASIFRQPAGEVIPSWGGPPASGVAEPRLIDYRPAVIPPPDVEDRQSGDVVCLGQFLEGYLLAAAPDRLLLIDQHAAHERIIYERVMRRFREQGAISQGLLVPAHLDLSAEDHRRIERILPLLEKIGCRLEAFGPRTFRVLELPPEISPERFREFIAGLIDLFEETDDAATDEPAWREKAAATIACHAAVKIGDRMRPVDMAALLRDLLDCHDPFHCPHGRPAMVEMGKDSVEKLFHRR